MSKIMELRTKRNTLWEQTKAFLEKHRGENGLVEASAVETYNKMAADVQALGAEIERLEQQAAVDAALSAPTSKPVTNAPTDTGRKQPDTNPTASAEYSDAFWNMIRNKGDQFAVRNALSLMGIPYPDAIKKAIDVLQKKTGKVDSNLSSVIEAMNDEDASADTENKENEQSNHE